MYTPFNYDKINWVNGHYFPSGIKRRNNRSFDYWCRALFQRAVAVFEWDLPETWTSEAKDFFLYCLYKYGYVCVFKHKKFGYTFQPCNLSGFDWYYQPTTARIANPKWSGELKIGKDCQLIKITPDYFGLWDVIERYGYELAEITADIEMSLVNNKVPFAVGVRNKVAGAIVKKAFDMVQNGEPAVVADMRLLKDKTDDEEAIHFLDRNLASQYITDKLLTDMRTILGNFNTEIGIPNVGYEKKERLTNDEVNSNNVETMARMTVWYDCLNRSIDAVNKMFPDYSISVKIREFDMSSGEGSRTNESEVDS